MSRDEIGLWVECKISGSRMWFVVSFYVYI